MGGMKNLFGDEPFDATQSRAARDAGLNLVNSNNSAWLEQYHFSDRLFAARLVWNWRGYSSTVHTIAENQSTTTLGVRSLP